MVRVCVRSPGGALVRVVCTLFMLLVAVVLLLVSSLLGADVESLGRQAAALEKLPVSDASGRATGMLKIKGVPSEVEEPPKEPVGGKEVIYYHHRVQVKEVRKRTTGTGRRRRTRTEIVWNDAVNEKRHAKAFKIGAIRVVPRKAVFYGEKTLSRDEGSRRESLYVVPAGVELLVVGECRSTPSGGREMSGGDVFLISSLSEKALLEFVRKRAETRGTEMVVIRVIGVVLLVAAFLPLLVPLITGGKKEDWTLPSKHERPSGDA